MTIRNLRFLIFLTVTFVFQSCLQCITGGQLHIKKNYVSNVCGLVNGVYVREIKVDSFQNDIPTKYTTIRSAPLYRQGASPNNDPKKLYFDKDCKEIYLWEKENIVDTVTGPLTFKKETWYLFSSRDAHTGGIRKIGTYKLLTTQNTPHNTQFCVSRGRRINPHREYCYQLHIRLTAHG